MFATRVAVSNAPMGSDVEAIRIVIAVIDSKSLSLNGSDVIAIYLLVSTRVKSSIMLRSGDGSQLTNKILHLKHNPFVSHFLQFLDETGDRRKRSDSLGIS